MLPESMAAGDLPREMKDTFVRSLLGMLGAPRLLQNVDSGTKRECAQRLVAMSGEADSVRGGMARPLTVAAALLYRDLGDQPREMNLLLTGGRLRN